jgi:CARDB
MPNEARRCERSFVVPTLVAKEIRMNLVFQYAVKVVLGKSEGEVVAPGEYWTAINVHNPTYTTVRFRKKIAIGLPGEQAGPVSRFFDAKLGPDEALEIDRRDVFEHVGTDRFLKGYVVIESPMELDVVAVYTAAGQEGFVETLHTERVAPRRLEVGLPDLVPVPDAQGSFCKREGSNLIVTVSNQGPTGAGPSTTRVDFGAHGTIDLPTPALFPGASVDLKFPIPPGCFDPNCEFRIIVDVSGVVGESNEGNNIASGVCLG